MHFARLSVASTAFFLLLSAAGHADSAGSYAAQVEGFQDGHFDEVGKLEGCHNPGPGLLFRSGAPQLGTDAAIGKLLGKRISLLVDLRAEHSSRTREETFAADNDMSYVNLALSAGDRLEHTVRLRVHPAGQAATTSVVPPVDGALAVIALIDEALAAGRNVLIHCAHGEDRTGTIIALWRDCRGDARREFTRYYGTWYRELAELFAAVEERRRVSHK